MSDGPHRSLPLRKHWKDLAERAAKSAFSVPEVCEALPVALGRDFLIDVPFEAIAEAMVAGTQSALFDEDRAQRLDALRSLCRGSVTGNLVIDCAMEIVSRGAAGPDALVAAVTAALNEHSRGTFRSMEEHYQREGSPRSAEFLRRRLEQARSSTDMGRLAHEIISERGSLVTSLTKHRGLDEGPALNGGQR